MGDDGCRDVITIIGSTENLKCCSSEHSTSQPRGPDIKLCFSSLAIEVLFAA